MDLADTGLTGPTADHLGDAGRTEPALQTEHSHGSSERECFGLARWT
jgi:hypothetical protein